MSVCLIQGCDRPVDARGMCNTHYMQQRRAGLLPVGTRARASLEERFWRYVQKTPGCWVWTGRSRNKKGYGQIQIGGKDSKHVTAHRLSYTIHHGPIPEGMVVMHLCDNPGCVNPAHLKAGTQSENMLHAIHCGRKVLPELIHQRGEKHHKAKISEAEAIQIKASIESSRALAERFGVSMSAIQRIKSGASWKHLS